MSWTCLNQRGNLMKISEFARERGIEASAVYKYLERNPELKNQCRREGKKIVLTEKVLEELEIQYPLKNTAVVVNGIPEEVHLEALERLAKAQDVIIMLQNQISDCKLLLAEKENGIQLLEYKQEHMEERLIEEKMKREVAESRISTLQEELKIEKNKTWLQKLLKK